MAKPEWVTGNEAAGIMSKNSGHTIQPAYIRLLASHKDKKIRSKMLDGRTRVYHRGDVEAYRVRQNGKAVEPNEEPEPASC